MSEEVEEFIAECVKDICSCRIECEGVALQECDAIRHKSSSISVNMTAVVENSFSKECAIALSKRVQRDIASEYRRLRRAEEMQVGSVSETDKSAFEAHPSLTLTVPIL